MQRMQLHLPWSCLKQLQCYKEENRKNIDAQSDWSCPACHDLSLDEKKAKSHVSQHELLKVTWSPIWEPKELLHSSWANFRQMIQIYEAKQIAPPLDERLDNLERQGFCTSINHSRWKFTQGKKNGSKAYSICNQPIHMWTSLPRGTMKFESEQWTSSA